MLNRKYDYLHTRLMPDNRTAMIGKNKQVIAYFRRSVSVLLLGSGLEDVGFFVCLSEEAKNCVVLQNIRKGSGLHPAQYLRDLGGCFFGVRGEGR